MKLWNFIWSNDDGIDGQPKFGDSCILIWSICLLTSSNVICLYCFGRLHRLFPFLSICLYHQNHVFHFWLFFFSFSKKSLINHRVMIQLIRFQISLYRPCLFHVMQCKSVTFHYPIRSYITIRCFSNYFKTIINI